MVVTESNSTQIKLEESSITDRQGEEGSKKFNTMSGTSLVIQGLRLHALNAGGPGSIWSRELRIPHTITKSLNAVTEKIPRATTKIEDPCHN